MTLAQFLEQFASVVEAFDHRKFPMVVLERIHIKVSDLSPLQMKELCNLIVDQCEHAPRTAKVAEFANIVRARHREGIRETQFEIQPLCRFCDDLRAVRAVATDHTHETLMLCECTTVRPDANDWHLPAWSRKWAPLYSKEQCPLSWFRVIVEKYPNGDFKIDSINRTRDYWREKIRIAEQFWISQRNECEGA